MDSMQFAHYHHCISTMPLFQGLAVAEIRSMQEQIVEINYDTGDFIQQAGDSSDSLYLIQSGLARSYRIASNGKEQQIRLLEEGDFIGEFNLFQPSVTDRYIQTLSPTKLCSISGAKFRAILLAQPEIALEMLAVLAQRLNDAEEQTTIITTESVSYRLAHFLLKEAEKQGSLLVRLRTNKKNIASFLGMSAESFSRGLSKLTKEGIVKQPAPDLIEILNLPKLEALCPD